MGRVGDLVRGRLKTADGVRKTKGQRDEETEGLRD